LAAFTFYVDKKVKAVEQRLQIFSFCNAEAGKDWAEEFKQTIERMLVKNTNIRKKEKKVIKLAIDKSPNHIYPCVSKI